MQILEQFYKCLKNEQKELSSTWNSDKETKPRILSFGLSL